MALRFPVWIVLVGHTLSKDGKTWKSLVRWAEKRSALINYGIIAVMEEPELCPTQSTAHFTCQEPWFSDFALLAIWFPFAQLPCFARHAPARPQPNTFTQTVLVEDRSSQQPLAEVGFKSWLFRWEFDGLQELGTFLFLSMHFWGGRRARETWNCVTAQRCQPCRTNLTWRM